MFSIVTSFLGPALDKTPGEVPGVQMAFLGLTSGVRNTSANLCMNEEAPGPYFFLGVARKAFPSKVVLNRVL